MRRPLVHCLIALVLLTQGLGSAWAATRMTAGEVAFAAHLADLPPCHQQQAQDDREAAAKTGGMPCCGTAACHCAMSCGAAMGLSFDTAALRHARQVEPVSTRVEHAPHAVFYGPPLRPPAPLQS